MNEQDKTAFVPVCKNKVVFELQTNVKDYLINDVGFNQN